jgi:hypothetical protein
MPRPHRTGAPSSSRKEKNLITCHAQVSPGDGNAVSTVKSVNLAMSATGSAFPSIVTRWRNALLAIGV